MAHRRAISERSNPRHRSRHAGILLGGVVCAGLLVAPITPAWAEAGAADESAGSVVGGFGAGDGIEALVDERDGALTFALPAGGLDLTWDSRAVSSDDRSGLGKGWGHGLGAVQTAGGVQFSPASGGRYELDSSHASGLHGYGARDIAFRMVDDGRVPARTDAAVADRAYRYRLHELGGTVTSFNELGDPITRVSATGQRVDWVWSDDVAHRLERIVDADGVVTELERAPDAVVVRPAANLPLPDGADGAPEWRVELGDDGITAIEDPTGGRVEVAYESGLVRSIGGVAGVRTEVEWRSSDDGAARVARVVAVDGDGVEVSRREWSPIGADLPSGWPAQQVGAASRFLAAGGYSTELTDGSTAVRSTYSAAHLLSARSMLVTTAGGERVVQQQSFRYPADELPGGGPDPAALPGDWNRPTSVSVTRGAADGSERTTTSTSEFDDLGRPVRGADGTTYAYDAANRPISRTRDGQTVQTSYWGDGARRSLTRVDEPGADPVQTTYFWDGATLVNEVHTLPGADGDAGGGAASYLLGVTRHARTTVDDAGRRTAYLGTDRHGNVTDLTDEHGEVRTRYGYSDYGVQTTVSSDVGAVTGLARNPFGYAGEQTDDDGTLYLRARVYEPVSMRFTSEDQAERLDRYNYADLNPIMKVDPSGRTPEWDEIVDLVTGGLALASLAGSAVMAAFTGGLSLTGLGIMGIASDVVTVLAVTARAVDRELPDLGILDEDGEKMLLGVELAFGAFGGMGVGADVSQLRSAEALYAVERDADRLLGTTYGIRGTLNQRSTILAAHNFGADPWPLKHVSMHNGVRRTTGVSVHAELDYGDRLIRLANTRLGEYSRIFGALKTYSTTHAEMLDGGRFLLKGYGQDRVAQKLAQLSAAGDQTEAIREELELAVRFWGSIKLRVGDAISGVKSDLSVANRSGRGSVSPAPGPRRSSTDGSESDDDGLGFSFIADAFR
jgi:RHS repeat-associated protein